MSDTNLTQPPQARADFEHVSDAMVYDIAPAHRLGALLDPAQPQERRRRRCRARHHWAARRRLVKQQVRALDADDRAGLIAQDEVWRLEKLALTGTE